MEAMVTCSESTESAEASFMKTARPSVPPVAAEGRGQDYGPAWADLWVDSVSSVPCRAHL